MTKWFGEPWPADWETNGRAGVCSNDADRVPTPVGSTCGYCSKQIWNGDQGVVMPYLRADQTTGKIAYHLKCQLEMVLGPIAAQVMENMKEE